MRFVPSMGPTSSIVAAFVAGSVALTGLAITSPLAAQAVSVESAKQVRLAAGDLDQTPARPDATSAMLAARAGGVAVEDVSQRTSHTRVYAMPDGTWSADDYSDPVFVHDGDPATDPGVDGTGAWHEIDTHLVHEDGGWRPAHSNTDVTFSDGGDQAFAELATKGQEVSFGLGGDKTSLASVTLPRPVVDGDTIVYPNIVPNVLPGVDLVARATTSGFTHWLVLTERPTTEQAAELSFPVTIAQSGKGGDLDVTKKTTGALVVKDDADKTVVSAPAPIAWDASSSGPDDSDPARSALAILNHAAPPATDETADSSGTSTVPLETSVANDVDLNTDTKGGDSAAVIDLSTGAEFLTNPDTVYPVTIDPSEVTGTTGDTWAANKDYTGGEPSADDLRVGTTDGGTHKYRSFIRFSTSKWTGKHVTSATLALRNFERASCTAGTIQVARIAQSWDPATMTWGNQPTSMANGVNGSGVSYYDCPDSHSAAWNITAMAQLWASGTAQYGVRVMSTNETYNATYRRYRSANFTDDVTVRPHINFDYNSYPNTPTTPTISPVTSWSGSLYTSDTTPQVTTTVSDPDAGLVKAVVGFYTSQTATTASATCTTGSLASGSQVSCSPTTALANGTYYVKAQASDGTDLSKSPSGWTKITIAAGAPAKPTVNCPGYADGSWTDTLPSANVSCTITATGNGVTSPGTLTYSIDGGAASTATITQPTTATPVTKSVSVPATGRLHQIVVTDASPAGVKSETVTYQFGLGSVAMSSPSTSYLQRSTGSVPIRLTGPPQSGTAPTYTVQWRTANPGGTDTAAQQSWRSIANAALVETSGSSLSMAGTIDLEGALKAAGTSTRIPVTVDLQICINYATGPKCSWANNHNEVLFSPHAFGDGYPTATVPGGDVSLFSGEFTTSVTDASMAAGGTSLSIGRTQSTFDAPGSETASGIFGPGWSADLAGLPGGYAGWEIADNTVTQGVITISDDAGSTLILAPTTKDWKDRAAGASLVNGTWYPVDSEDQESGVTATVTTGSAPGLSSTQLLSIVDADGVTTTYYVNNPGATGAYDLRILGTAEAGSVSSSSYTYNGAGLITRVLAPQPSGVQCPSVSSGAQMPAGCRALAISYSGGRVEGIETQIGSGTGGSASTERTPVASYLYDAGGHLVSETDPRTGLKTTYTYDGSNRITSIQAPGVTAAQYVYNSSGQLVQVTRATDSSDSPAGTADLATVVYNVPLSGSGPNLSDDAISAWGQPTSPVYAAAVFGPNHPLALGVTVSDLTAADYKDAALFYTDADGYTLNSAVYGSGRWLISDTEYNELGDPVRQLATGDVAAIQDGDITAADAGTLTVYNADQHAADATLTLPADSEVTDVFETARYVQLANGNQVWARPHIHTSYDQGAPNDGINAAGGEFGMPTTNTQGVSDPSLVIRDAGATEPADLETESKIRTGYADAVSGDPEAGWTIGLASSSTVVMDDSVAGGTSGAANITTKATYNAEGQTASTSQPMSNGSDAGTRDIIYYASSSADWSAWNPTASEASHSACEGRPQWVGLICETVFAGNPTNGGSLIATTYTYTPRGEVSEAQEKSGSATRTTSFSYDSAARISRTSTTTTGAPDSVPVPATTYQYDSQTGLQKAIVPDSGTTISTTYDSWGRVKSYATADGTTTNSYDIAGNLLRVVDGAGTATDYTYNGADAAGLQEHRGFVTGIKATASAAKGGTSVDIHDSYDASGDVVTQAMSGGITATNAFDTGGDLVGRTYSGDVTSTDDSGTSTTDVDSWLGWSQKVDGLGRVSADWTPGGAVFSGNTPGSSASGSSHTYTYDPDGRLATVRDHSVPAGGGGADADGTPELEDQAANCTVREYGFDADGNRTSLSTIPAAADGSCQTQSSASGAATKSWTYDANGSDRVTNAGYVFDAFGRETSLPQDQTPLGAVYQGAGAAPGALSLSYYDTDAVRSMAQGGQTTTYDLDAAGRPLTETASVGGSTQSTVSLGYNTPGDSPSWEATSASGAASWEGYVSAPDGGLAATLIQTQTNAVATLSLSDPRGNVVAQVSIPTGGGHAVGIDNWITADEYGNSTSAGRTATNSGGTGAADGSGGLGYGWTGVYHRATSDTGLILMGARLYDSTTGQFTSPDPVYGGNTTPYAYPQDPINAYDLTGACWKHFGAVCSAFNWVKKHWGDIAVTVAIVAVQFIPIADVAADGMLAADIAVESEEAIAVDEATTKGAGQVAKGKAGEKAVSDAYDIGPKKTVKIHGRKRIFDGFDGKQVSEVKNVKKQGLTQQIRDDIDWVAAHKGTVFVLWVRQDTVLTKPLIRAIMDGKLELAFIPGT